MGPGPGSDTVHAPARDGRYAGPSLGPMTGAPASRAGWDADDFRLRLQETLDEFLAEQAVRLEPLGPDAVVLHDEARAVVSGGKRFRAAFCYWGYRAIRGSDPSPAEERAVLRAAAALEVLH